MLADARCAQLVEIATNTIFSKPAFTIYGGAMARDRFEPPVFLAKPGGKDIMPALAAAGAAAFTLRIAGVVQGIVTFGVEGEDLAASARTMTRRAVPR